MDSQINIDVNNLCRTCLSSTVNLRSLSAPISDTRTVFDALSNVLNKDIMISELLPYKICEECESCLYQYDNFKQKCLENEEVIKNWFISNSTDKSEDSCCSEDVALHITIPYQCAICLEKFMNIIDLQDHYANVHVDKNDKVEIFYTQERNPVWVSTFKQESSEESSSEEDSSEGVSDSENHLTTQTLYNFDTIEESNECVIKESTEAISVEVLKSEDIVKVEKQEDVVHNELNNSKSNEISEMVEKKLVEQKFEVPIVEYHCNICDTVFKTVRAIKIHTKRKHGFAILDNKVNPDEECVEGEPLQCSMCMRKFNKKSCLERHLKKHEEDLNNVYTCNFCKREFQRKAHLENHITTLHMKQKAGEDSLDGSLKKHKCKHCGKCFQLLSTLKDHLRVHTGEKPFLCSTCGRGFSQKTNLKEHMRRHEGLKPYKCAVCGQGFVSKGELTSHQRTHTGAHPFLCDVCSNGFTTSSSLAKHKRIHLGDKRFSCDLCPMKFTASNTLKNHRRTHTGEKPFSCSHCDKAFVQRHDLVAHTRCHTGERPYICAVCGQAFRQNSALRTHTKIHKETPVQNLQLSRNLNNNGSALLQQNVCLRQLHLS